MNIIVAYCKNQGIGLGNRLPWRLKADLRHFRDLTIGNGYNAIIMGRKTWDSLPESVKPLPKRTNIILSRNKKPIAGENTHIFSDIKSAKCFCAEQKYDEVWIIGGQNIYEQFIGDPQVENIYVTYLDELFKCDTFFPPFKSRFKLRWQSDLRLEVGFLYRLQQYVRKERVPT